jgi:hypothetical protein
VCVALTAPVAAAERGGGWRARTLEGSRVHVPAEFERWTISYEMPPRHRRSARADDEVSAWLAKTFMRDNPPLAPKGLGVAATPWRAAPSGSAECCRRLTGASAMTTLSGMNCLACGQAAAPGARFCIACGGHLGSRCPRCGSVPPADARFCPGCGVRVGPQAGEPTPRPSSEPSTPTTDPLEELELKTAIERIRRGERRRRGRRRRVVAAGVVAALAGLVGAAWLVLAGRHTARPVRVAVSTSAPGVAATPPTPEAETRLRGDLVAVPESATTRDARDVGATAGEPQRPAPSAPEVERGPSSRTPSPREEVASPPARALPHASDVRLPPRERPQPESPSALSSRAQAGPVDSEVGVEITTEPLVDGLVGYTVHLRERDGRPVTDATVSIRGRGADGGLVEVTLHRAAESGAYRAVAKFTGEITDARLRIASVGRVQEVLLPDAPR